MILQFGEGLFAAACVTIFLELLVHIGNALSKGRTTKMPVAVVQGEPDRFELKMCPGGYVTIRRMTYGEKLIRRQFNSKMDMEVQKGGNAKTTLDMFNERVELYDFANCIVDHNLTDADERPLNFKNVADVKLLAGNIAEEIGTYIDKVNNFEESDEVKN